jgi:hypothetical protein
MISLSITTFVFILYFLVIWIRQCSIRGLAYFKSIWGCLETLSLVFNIVIVFLVLFNHDIKVIRTLTAYAVFLMWLKIPYFMRIIDSTAPFIRMISEIIKDSRDFMLVFLLVIVAFGNSFYLLG